MVSRNWPERTQDAKTARQGLDNMKTPLVQFGKWMIIAGGLILGIACVEGFLTADGTDNASSATTPIQLAQADPVPSPTPASPQPAAPAAKPDGTEQAASTNTVTPSPEKTNAPAPADVKVVQNPVPPANVELSPALAEIVKLIQAGVSEDVILTYITSSTNIFYVGSDQIVYLNDIGVSSALLTVLIQHEASPETLARKQAAVAVQPLPAGVAINYPATNIYPSHTTLPESTDAPPLEPAEGQAATLPEQPVSVAGEATNQAVSVDYFQTALSPYGTWITVPNYGLCWRPTVAVADCNWRPYAHHGRWVWTDCGWYWYSHYSWGWAPFHYGRWCDYPRVGWVWVPDTVWGPSWVTWRYNSYYCGWAPLPPRCHYVSGFGLHYRNSSVGFSYNFGLASHCYTVLPLNRFCSPKPHHYYANPTLTAQFYRESAAVTHITENADKVPNNHGIGYDRVAKVTREEIRRVNIREMPKPMHEGGLASGTPPARVMRRPATPHQLASYTPPVESRGELLDRETDTLLVHRPRLSKVVDEKNGRAVASIPAKRIEVWKPATTTANVQSEPATALRPSVRSTGVPRSALRSPETAKTIEVPKQIRPESATVKTGRGGEPTAVVHANRPKSIPAERIGGSAKPIVITSPAPVPASQRPDARQPARTERPRQTVPSWMNSSASVEPSRPTTASPVGAPKPAQVPSTSAARAHADYAPKSVPTRVERGSPTVSRSSSFSASPTPVSSASRPQFTAPAPIRSEPSTSYSRPQISAPAPAQTPRASESGSRSLPSSSSRSSGESRQVRDFKR